MKKLLLLLTLSLMLVIPAGCGDDEDPLAMKDILGIWGPDGDVTLSLNDCEFPDEIAKAAPYFKITKVNEEKFKMENCLDGVSCQQLMPINEYIFGSELQMALPDMPIKNSDASSCEVVFGGTGKLTMKDGETDFATATFQQTATRTVGEGVTDAAAECKKLEDAMKAHLATLTEGTPEHMQTGMAVMILGATTQDKCSIKRTYDIKKYSKE